MSTFVAVSALLFLEVSKQTDALCLCLFQLGIHAESPSTVPAINISDAGSSLIPSTIITHTEVIFKNAVESERLVVVSLDAIWDLFELHSFPTQL
jgi:hypothetical protein